jgi:hypothetical protein
MIAHSLEKRPNQGQILFRDHQDQISDSPKALPQADLTEADLSRILEQDYLDCLLGKTSGARGAKPEALNERLKFLSDVVGALASAYTDEGIRRWFKRQRSQLDGRAPEDLLVGDWEPNSPEPARVRTLAVSLGSMMVT